MISIIIPLYNKQSVIERTITSIIQQTYSDWELIIIDDGSTDNSATVVEKYLNNHRIHYIHKLNGGVSSARNMGINKARGEWIVYIDADDYFMPDALQILINIASKYKTDIACGNYYNELMGVKKIAMHCRKEGIISDNFKSWFFYESCPRAGAAIFKSSLLKSHLFDESLSRYEDAKSLFDILRNHRMTYSPQPVMVYSQDNLNLSKRAKEFSMDFISCLDFNNKPYWECILLGNLVNQGIKTYPELSKQIKKQYIAYKKYLLLANWYIYIRKLKNLTSCFREYIK